jgi:hypothetical protein
MNIQPFALVIAVIGVLLYALTDGKLSEVGRIAFFVGLLGVVLGK